MKMATSCPSFASAFGSDPHTSPNPPVFAMGETSAVVKRIFIERTLSRHCHPEPPEPRSAKREMAEDGRRTPFLATRKGGRYSNTASTKGILRPSSATLRFALRAPAAQDDRRYTTTIAAYPTTCA